MSISNKLLRYIVELKNDAKLNVWHFALLLGIVQFAFIQKQCKLIRISRRKLMKYAHITTLPTYHKYLKELQELGYIKYTPSYHPDMRSTVELLHNSLDCTRE
ncbi:hypothetical protein [Myroides odoratimimus]|uniref:Uncharacterized protein n=1 Tax=Myroides odoratimimus TaxID=76832 RepID=A0AAI8G608_9FLAO|nr:hypothetical protein [Myroides odoratimimus]ALU27406.1 hypothetical protein AS202_15145 [Myroides odoratimimus]MDM1039839.1 hypothetical protein [Myroides odoratimimus]MDM1054078.1 hypothetical protein [Myroides odoratimimus]MDM1461966.1 hypothetical protein [Myroides odoratimimus]